MLKPILILFSLLTALSGYANTSHDYQIQSLALAKVQSISVHLPDNYNNKKPYPVVYVLNTHDFYAGDFKGDFLHRIRQLEGYQQIPATIVVFINNPAWYSTLFNQTEALSQFISAELARFVQNKYLTEQSHLFAHSYGAAYLLNQSPLLQQHFTHLHALSVVFPNVDYVQQTATQIEQLVDSQGQVNLLQELGHQSDTQFLNKAAQNKAAFNQRHIANQNHQSVVPIAIAEALRSAYPDYAVTDYLNQFDLNKAQLTERYIAIRKKYLQTSNEQDLQSFYSAMAQNKMESAQLALAFSLWQDASPRFRHYFINRWAERYLAQNKPELARTTWQQLTKLYPHSLFAWHKLAVLAKQRSNLTEHKLALKTLKQAASNFTEPDQQLMLAFTSKHHQDYPKLSIAILKRITDQTPANKTAWQQLSDLYKQQGDASLSEQAQSHLKTL